MSISLDFATHLSHLPGWGNGADVPGLASIPSISASVRDLWEHTANGTHAGTFTALVEAHGVVMLRLSRAM
jgi:hypothetical protein